MSRPTEVRSWTQMLMKISDDMTSVDLDKIKSTLEMEDILQARELEKVTTAFNIFLLLKKKNLLSPSNMKLLKSVLEIIARKDLLEWVLEFEKSSVPEPLDHISGPILQETEFEDNRVAREENSEELNDFFRCQFNSSEAGVALVISPDASQSEAPSDTTLLKQRLPLAPHLRLISDGIQDLQLGEEIFSTAGSTNGNDTAIEKSAEFDLGEPTVSVDGDLPSSSTSVGRFFCKEQPSSLKTIDSVALGEFIDLTAEPCLTSANLRDDGSLEMFSGSLQLCPELDAMKKLSLCTHQCTHQGSKVKLREYQLELAEPSLKGLNRIICAPTGSGKTLTAGFIFQERLKLAVNERRKFCGLFIVCRRILVLQQKKALEDFLGPEIQVGAVDENQLLIDVLVIPYHLIVLTAQKLVNALDACSIKIQDFGMLIIDECHHTDLNHPYNKIMRYYHLQHRNGDAAVQLPMIVGLTASLGVGPGKHKTDAKLHYIKICANLNCTHITHVRNEYNERQLLRFNPKPSADQIKPVEPRSKDSPFYQVMTKFMGNIEMEAQLNFARPIEHGTHPYENWVVEHKMEALTREGFAHIFVACEALEKLNRAWMLHDQMRIKDAKDYLDSYFTSDWLPLDPSPIHLAIWRWYRKASERLDLLIQEETINTCPQLQELCKLLTHLHRTHADARGILLARTRLNVARLIKFLSEETQFQDVIFPAKLVGQGGQEDAMTQTEQENTLRCFRLEKEDAARVNLLVATDVAQEGLDLPKCNYVIRYDFVSDEIGSVQSRGRARAPKSELYLIVTRGSVNETRELENLQKEHKMLEALKLIDMFPEIELKESIMDLQEKNWLDYQCQLKRDLARSSAVDPSLVKIHCSKCKEFLCDAKDLRLRGSNYICIAEDFEGRIIFKKASNVKEYATEMHLGLIYCKAPNCPDNQLGQKLQYKQGSRMYGFLLRREGCVFRIKDKNEFMTIKKWSKVPFVIEQEVF